MTPTSPVPAPQGPNQNPRSTHSYQPVSMNWYILEAVQNSRILSVGATPVLLFTSCLTPFVELLHGATQASRHLVNFKFTKSMKSLTSAFWCSIANVPMGIIAVATTPFDKGRRARKSYPKSMIPVDARSPAHLPTQVIDKDAIQRELKREAELKEQVAILRSLLPPEQGEELDLQLGYEAQFAKALELIQERVRELRIDADPKKLQDACNDIYEKATNTLWNLLTAQQQNDVNNRFSFDNPKTQYEMTISLIRIALNERDAKFNRHIANTLNFIATLAGIQTIDVKSDYETRIGLFRQLEEKLSEVEKEEIKTINDFANKIKYLFLKLSAVALAKAGEEALLNQDVVNLRKEFDANRELLKKAQTDLEDTKKALAAQKQLSQETEQKLLEATNNYNIAKSSLEKLENDTPQETKELLEKIKTLDEQHANVLNDLKLEHEKAIGDLKKTINENKNSIEKAEHESLQHTNTIKKQKELIEALEKEHAKEIKELKESHDTQTTELTNGSTAQISLLKKDHQEQIGEIETRLRTLQKKHEETLAAVREKAVKDKEKLTQQISELKNRVNANTALQQELEESKKAVEQSQEKARQLENKNEEQLILIETLKKELEDVKRASLENQSSKSLPLPTRAIPSASPAETKKEVPELNVPALEEGSSEPRLQTPPSDNEQDVNGSGTTTSPKETRITKAYLTQLSELLAKADNNFGSALNPKEGHRLSIKAHQSAKALFGRLEEDPNSDAVQALIEQWKEISPTTGGKTKALELTVDQFTKFTGAVKAAQEAVSSSV